VVSRFPQYRIVERGSGWEPQMLYRPGSSKFTGPKGVWFPLNSQGYWLEPDAFDYGDVTKHAPLPTREEAERAIERAKLINSDNAILRSALQDARDE
jgi:hypothetical protein